MSISLRSTFRWSSAGVVMLALTALGQPPGLPPFLQEFQGGAGRELPPFLDDYFAQQPLRLVTATAECPSAVGSVSFIEIRQADSRPLPAVLLVYDEAGWPAAAMVQHGRDLASLGYRVWIVDLETCRRAAKDDASYTDEAALTRLQAVVRYLRRNFAVPSEQLSVIGWGWSGGQALALAMAVRLQACIVCDTLPPTQRLDIRGLRGVPLLAIYGSDGAQRMTAFRSQLDAEKINNCTWHFAAKQQSGFMGPPQRKTFNFDAAEEAWVAIYNFLEAQVEKAQPSPALANPPRTLSTIADLMLAVNAPSGLRGTLRQALAEPPATPRDWQRIRANAALVTEAGLSLQARQPPKGPVAHWQAEAKAFTAAAEALVEAADRRDYAAAQRGLTRLAEQCAACHSEHR